MSFRSEKDWSILKVTEINLVLRMEISPKIHNMCFVVSEGEIVLTLVMRLYS
jgi:hypothetical protein